MQQKFSPSYIKLYKTGELEKRIEKAYQILKKCVLCPNFCKTNREIEKGKCNSLLNPIISSYNLHFGEEPPISGFNGSGTIFFTNCTMKCIYCQNYPISQLHNGKEISVKELADIFLYLQKKNAHNINFVTPTHFVPQILNALHIAIKNGFNLPLVYNTSGYESPITLKLLDGIIDIYLPDIKYMDDKTSLEYSGVTNYTKFNQIAIKEMYKQVGDLKLDEKNIAYRGLLIRHLVLPGHIENSKKVFDFLKNEIGTNINISLMSQYFPAYKAINHKIINRKLKKDEYENIIEYALKLGFENIFIQEI